MKILYLVEPNNIPITFRNPGEWIQYKEIDDKIEINNLNVKFWNLIYSKTFINILEENNVLDIDNINSYLDNAKKSLINLKKNNTYNSLETYVKNIISLIKYTEQINSLNLEFYINILNGIRALNVNYNNLKSILNYCKKQTILYKLIEYCLNDFDKETDLILMKVNSPFSLLTSILIGKIIKRKSNAHICIIESSYENFALSNIKELLYDEDEFFNIFDTIVDGIEDKDKIVSSLIYGLNVGNKFKGFIKLSDLKQSIPTTNTRMIPYIEVFTPDTVLSTKLLNSSCYWKKCSFCAQNLKYNNSIDEIRLNEIMGRIACYIDSGYKIINFTDEALPPQFLDSFSREILRQNIKFSWVCRCRLESSLSKELLHLMRDAGCKEILYGIESISHKVLKLMNKYPNKIDDTSIKEILKNTYNAGIRVHATIIVGFPGEEIEDAINTANFITNILNDMKNSVCWINQFTLFKNTFVYNNSDLYNIKIHYNNNPLDSIYNFNYLEGDYTDKKVLINTINTVSNKIYNGLGWKNFNNNKLIFEIMKIYFFTSHGFILKENEKLSSNDIEKILYRLNEILV
ncbi:B12-binding domain-containing radical SAM protein [Clostridium senegalense]